MWIEGVGHYIAHPGKEGDGAGDTGKASRVLHAGHVRINIAEHLPVDLLDGLALLRDGLFANLLERLLVCHLADVLLYCCKMKKQYPQILSSGCWCGRIVLAWWAPFCFLLKKLDILQNLL